MKDYPFEKSFYCLNASGVDDYFQFILGMSGGTENLSGGTSGVNVHLSAGTYQLYVYTDTGSTFNYSAATYLGYDEMWVDKNLIANPTPPTPISFPSTCLPVTVTDHSSGVTIASGGVYSCVPFSSVTVYDSLGAQTANTLNEGQTYTCTTATPVTTTKVFSFGVTSSEQYEKIRIDSNSTIDLASATLINVASVVYRKNNSIVSGVQTFSIGDYLQINITRTNNSLASSVSMTFTYTTDSSTIDVPEYYFCKWTNLLGGTTVDSTTFCQSRQGLSGGTNGTGTFDKGANSVDSFSGAFTVETEYSPQFSTFGINTSNSETTGLFARAEYMFYWPGLGNIYVYENGTIKANIVISNQNSSQTGVRIKDTGAAIEFYVKQPGGAWTLAYTSVSAYFPNRTYYVDRTFAYDANLAHPVKLYI